MFLHEKLYKQIIKHVPILCVDLILKNNDGEFLLNFRGDEPLAGTYFVPGGRVFSGETLLSAAERKFEEEISIGNCPILTKIGIYEDTFEASSFGKHPYHTVSVVFTGILTSTDQATINNKNLKWSKKLPPRLLGKIEWINA